MIFPFTLVLVYLATQWYLTLWTVASQAPLYIVFFRQEYRSGLPFSSPGDLTLPVIECASPVSPALQVDSLPAEPPEKTQMYVYPYQIESTSRLSKVLIGSLKHKHSSPLYLKKKKIHSLKALNHMIFSLKEQVYLLLVLLRI